MGRTSHGSSKPPIAPRGGDGVIICPPNTSTCMRGRDVQLTTQQALHLAAEGQTAGDLAMAESLCRQVLAQQPNNPEALYMLGTVAQDLGRHQDAIALFRQSIAVNPRVADVHAALGMSLESLGDLP